jgi:AcrR family transcriptional regulator
MTFRPVGRDTASQISTRESLILSAERLFGRQGVDGVSLRQIAADAGAANNSAVHYHFGSKESLVQAIFEYRLPMLMQRRKALAAERKPGLRGCMENYLLPLVELAEVDDCCYSTFLQQLQGASMHRHPFSHLPRALQQPHTEFMQEATGFLDAIPVPLRVRRVNQASTMCLHTSADRERARRRGAASFPFALHVSELFDAMIGVLLAPVSAPTLLYLSTEAAATVTPAATA